MIITYGGLIPSNMCIVNYLCTRQLKKKKLIKNPITKIVCFVPHKIKPNRPTKEFVANEKK